MTSVIKHPSILWAQRAGQIFLTIEDGDLKIKELVCEDDKFKIIGEKGSDKYEADLVLYAKLKGAERRKVETNRRLELIIPKETEEWWPRLLKATGKVPWIKVDFNKWKDQDEVSDYEDEGVAAPMDFSKFMPAGGRGFGSMPGGDEGFDDFDMGADDEMGDLENVGDDEDEGISSKEEKKNDENGANNKGECSSTNEADIGNEKVTKSANE